MTDTRPSIPVDVAEDGERCFACTADAKLRISAEGVSVVACVHHFGALRVMATRFPVRLDYSPGARALIIEASLSTEDGPSGLLP
jgi:hypothetical protein